MLKMRARGFALRDGFSDVLRGLGIAEEVQDTPMRDVTPPQPPRPPAPPAPPSETIADEDGVIIEHDDPTVEEVAAANEEVIDDTTFFERLEEALAVVSDLASLEEVWNDADPMARFDGKPQGEINQGIALAIRKRAEKRVGGAA
jgi:hypothetical protein